MLYVAVFRDGQVSLSYPSADALAAHNVFRINKVHGIVKAPSEEALKEEIKNSLSKLRKV